MNTSSINFDPAYSSEPLRPAAEALKEWLVRHPELPFFTFDQVCRELADRASAEHINRVLLRLQAAGELAVRYRVRIGHNEYSEDDFDSPESVPPTVFDSAFHPVRVIESDKVPAYIAPQQ